MHDRSGQPDNINSQEVANSQNFIMGRDTTELELSVESRSFVNQVNDQVRKRQKIISNVAGEGEEHSIIWGMSMAVTMNSATFMGGQGMGSPRHAHNRRRRTREGPELACVQTPFRSGVAHAGGEG